MVKKLSLLFIFLVLILLSFGREFRPSNVFFGIELIELQQNSFKNIGVDNHTFFVGTAFDIDKRTMWGLRYVGMNVELSEKHLQEPSPAYKGDFAGVTGGLNVQRLYADYYYTWNLNKVKIQPIMSLGAGYNNWQFYNHLVDDSYDLKTVSVGIAGKFRFTFFEYVFFEIPAIDVFLHVHKNRKPEHFLGEAHIAFNDYFGVFNWAFFGISIPIK